MGTIVEMRAVHRSNLVAVMSYAVCPLPLAHRAYTLNVSYAACIVLLSIPFRSRGLPTSSKRFFVNPYESRLIFSCGLPRPPELYTAQSASNEYAAQGGSSADCRQVGSSDCRQVGSSDCRQGRRGTKRSCQGCRCKKRCMSLYVPFSSLTLSVILGDDPDIATDRRLPRAEQQRAALLQR